VTESSSKILISACLLGQPVRYDGQSKDIENTILELWKSEGLLVPVCPEVSGGLPVPRPLAGHRSQLSTMKISPAFIFAVHSMH